MEEIKVGEYVRLDRNQGINKIVDIEDDVYYLDTEIWDEWGETTWSIYKEKLDGEIIKHSPNIIDLIEEGDYVNGCEVFQVTSTQLIVRDENGLSMWGKKIVEKYIKHIVTHEQFNSIKYVIGE
jgi:hypothetical protein